MSDHDGSIEVIERCGRAGCALDGSTTLLPGQVAAPGRWLDAAGAVAEALHGHEVEVSFTATTRPVGLGSVLLDRSLAGARRAG